LLEITLTIEPAARVDRLSGKAYVNATFTCSASTSLGMTVTLSQRLTRSSYATSTAYISPLCSPTPSTATFELIPTGNVPFGNGMALLNLAAMAYDVNYNDFVQLNFDQVIRLSPR
jgi:hypothetical protein